MKLLISNQHGAIVMALMPFFYGMLLSQPVWAHIFLLLAWFSLYLLSYPFLNLFKGRNLAQYKTWVWIYACAVIIFVIPALIYNWKILYFALTIALLSSVSVYFVKQKNERAFLNDLNGIVIFAVAGMGAYYFADSVWDYKIWQVACYPSLFFIGTTLYVKSMMRERKNPLYLKLSIIFHIGCILVFLFVQQYILTLAFIIPLVRAIYLPAKKLSVKQIGLIEMAVSLLFFVILLWATI
ncbi:YwiC-like family protein [Basfia succiniciproducens]|uniref:YwiC-like protein n=1 Tax=Basfia succiniciproducens TaxID=653940 RepID=A0A1G5AA96_9PAST|nr:YwiC-like family protein [Basfia succiniciproducens]QIM68280.1 hypothetical protein A4G13_02150 [Basfia succiniciproducens]SCX74804.1 YwiC-like protein [Basfia succiniciproducens]SEQ63478.1 YwiC-like protein [Basfia succiniciproducens]